MSITIRDCLSLPSFDNAKVIAGQKGLDSIIETVSVLEFYDDEEMFNPNELVISSLFQARKNILEQCKVIKNCKKSGDVGLVLFYSDVILDGIDSLLINTANELNFPLILLANDETSLRYSDVIKDVMNAIFLDEQINISLENIILNRISALPKSNLKLKNLLFLMRQTTKSSILITDQNHQIIDYSIHPQLSQNYNLLNLYKEFQKKDSLDIIHLNDEHSIAKRKIIFNPQNHIYLYVLCNTPSIKEVINSLDIVFKEVNLTYNFGLTSLNKQSIITNLLNNDIRFAKNLARNNNIDLDSVNCEIIIPLNNLSKNEKIKLDNQLIDKYGKNENFLINQYLNLLTILFTKNKHYNYQDEREFLIEEISPYLSNQKIAINEQIFSPEEILHFTKSFSNLENLAEIIYPYKKLLNFSHLSFLETCIDFINKNPDFITYSKNLLLPLLKHNSSKLLIKTLETFLIDCDSDIAKTSEVLFVHRNTVQYRLNLANQILENDIKKLPFSYHLYLALALYRYNSRNK